MRRFLPVSLTCLALLAALAGCGDSAEPDATSPASSTTPDTAETPDTADSPALVKPEVVIPAEVPTELVVTDLIEGSGEPADVGDTVEVHYVGVRSVNGEEFDNSYDQGEPFPVTLGQGGVIQGWEKGLIGIKEGGRRQLDIPAELAYGDEARPPVIQAGDALTFVIDAVSVIPIGDPADKPEVDLEPSVGATEPTSTEVIVGDGEEALAGQTAYLQITAYRGDNLEELQSTWDDGSPAAIPLDESTLPGIVDGVIGMKVGGRRILVLPPADAFGEEGNADMGLPPGTDLILVVDLVHVSG